MNKTLKIFLSIIGGVNVTFHIFTPIMIASLFGASEILNDFQMYFIFAIGFLSTLFRAIKVGWMK